MEVSLKDINKIAIPAIFANLSEPLIALGDTFILGKLDHSILATSAVSNATAFYLTIVWVLAQIKSSISAIISRYLGKDKLHEVESLVPQTIVLTASLGILLYLFTAPFASSILGFYEMSPAASNYAVSYYEIRAIGFPFILVAFTIFGVFRGLQNTFWPMIISISGGVLNLILDYCLVLGLDGVIKPMGVDGAAWASLIVQIYMCLAAIILLIYKTPFKLKLTWKLNPLMDEMGQITFNLFIRTLILNITVNLANKSATAISDAHNTAHTIAYQLWLFTAFFIDGYANAANAIGGRLLGSGAFKTMKLVTKKIIFYNIIISILLAVLFILGYGEISKLFNSSLYVNDLFNSIFWITLLVLPINAVAFSLDGLFKGLGEAKFLRNTLFIATFIVFIPLLYLGDYLNLGIQGVWMALFAWMTIRALLPWVWFNRMMNRKINI